MSLAKAPSSTAPIVDSLSVRVVVDSRHEAILPKETHDHVRIEHIGDIPDRIMHTLAAEWGLSLHLASGTGGLQPDKKMCYLYGASGITNPQRRGIK